MDRAKHLVGPTADVLHNIDLTTGRPGAVKAAVSRQHPERWPKARADGHLGAHLHSAVGPLGFEARAQSRRSVGKARLDLLLASRDRQHTVRHRRILVGVPLLFAVAPTARQALGRTVTDLETPLLCIDLGPVEIVRPDQLAEFEANALRVGRGTKQRHRGKAGQGQKCSIEEPLGVQFDVS